MRLHQLPDGTWVDPETIWNIQMYPRDRGLTPNAPRVVIRTLIACLTIDCESDEDASAMRDRIAALANEAAGRPATKDEERP
jgi:hypothetical protein